MQKIILVAALFCASTSFAQSPFDSFDTTMKSVPLFKSDKPQKFKLDVVSKGSPVKFIELDVDNRTLDYYDNNNKLIASAIIKNNQVKFLSVDPLSKKYPELTPYQFASNTPIQAIDLDGLERLDVSSYDAKTRIAAIQVVKNVYINSNNIPTQVAALGNTTFASIFSAGNTSLYVSAMPQNGQPLQIIDRKTYNKGTGFKLDITYNVTVQNTTTPAKIDVTNPANSLVQTGTAAQFSNPLAFARANTNGTNNVYINPNYTGFSPPSDWDATAIPSYEELVAHEVGFHNMGRQLHTTDRLGNAIYPTGRTLESNLPGQIRPSTNNTQTILNSALQNNNLNDPSNLLPKPPTTPAGTAPATTPATTPTATPVSGGTTTPPIIHQ